MNDAHFDVVYFKKNDRVNTPQGPATVLEDELHFSNMQDLYDSEIKIKYDNSSHKYKPLISRALLTLLPKNILKVGHWYHLMPTDHSKENTKLFKITKYDTTHDVYQYTADMYDPSATKKYVIININETSQAARTAVEVTNNQVVDHLSNILKNNTVIQTK